MQKPTIIRQIEQLQGENFTLHPATARPTLLDGVMAFKEGQPKYALDEHRQLIGLNLAATGLDDERWQEIVTLLEEHEVRLQALNLCENQLEKFVPPPGIAELISLDLEDNPLEFPPQEIVDRGPAAVLRFMQDAVSQGTRESFEVKMLIVGEGEAGKTTLWHLLQNPDYSIDEVNDDRQDTNSKHYSPTVGIQIKEGWEFAHLDRPDKKFLVNLWDFGGQEIQYMTHQFFLTRRSFYVLLANGRSESSNFPYWINIINVLGRSPGEKLPVLVVMNEKGNRNPAPPYDAVEVKTQYPDLKLIKRDVDFKEKGIRLEVLNEEIKDILCRQIAHLPVIIPGNWDAVRTKIKTLQKSVNHIDQAEFVRICEQHGIADRQKQDDLSRFLHDLGFILHFHELQLKNFVVLNPNWAVNAVYAVLENQEVKDFNQGRFNEKVLQDIWTAKGFSEDEQSKLISLMLKDGLEICFKATDNNGEDIFIAPQLLSDKAPEDADWNNNSETLRYVYDYNFMPKGIITRLIVRLHENIEGCGDGTNSCPDCQKLVWKSGAYLCRGGCRARVRLISDWQQQRERIQIEVQGGQVEERRHVLWDIREELNKIHRVSFSSLHVSEKIPCCCEECSNSNTPYEYDTADLERMKSKGIEDMRCMTSGSNILIHQLQDGISPNMGHFSKLSNIKERNEQPAVVIHNHLPSTDSSSLPVDPPKKPWYQDWCKLIAAVVGVIGSIASIIGLASLDFFK